MNTVRPVSAALRQLLPLLLVLALGACSVQQTRLTPGSIVDASEPVQRDTTIALLGGTGFVGGYLLREALSRGYPVRLLSRSPDNLAYLGERVTVINGDARDPGALQALLDGAQVVVSALGPPRARGDSRSGLNSAVTAALIPAMQAAGIERYLLISGAAVVMPGDARNLSGWWMRQLVRVRYPGILEDRQREYDLLAVSDLGWTLLRCPLIEGEGYQAPARVTLDTPAGFYLRAGELAQFLLDELETPRFRRQGPFLSSP